MAVPPQEVLSTVSSCSDQQRAPEHKGKGNFILRELTIALTIRNKIAVKVPSCVSQVPTKRFIMVEKLFTHAL